VLVENDLLTQVLCEALDSYDSHGIETTVQMIVDCLQDDADRVICIVRELLRARPQTMDLIAREVQHIASQPDSLPKTALPRDEQVIRMLETAASVLPRDDFVGSRLHDFGRRWLADGQERLRLHYAEEFAACAEAYGEDRPASEERVPRRKNRGAPAA
jgi:hypothetical protein